MLETVLRKVLPFRIVRRDDYMVRFFLWGSRGTTDANSGSSLRLHHIISSDDDVLYHNHPYAFKSLILWGGYIEHKPNCEPRIFKLGRINRSPLESFHRLELRRPAWTLVYCGPRLQDWGFWGGRNGDPFIPWREHKNESN